MDVFFSPVEKVTASQIVTQQLKKAIVSGEMEPGTKLPSERELSSQMKVSRPVIREAMVTLASYGLITSRQGEGNYVADRFSESVLGFLGFSNELTVDNYKYFFDCRLLFERGTAESIIQNVTKEGIEELKKINQIFSSEASEEAYIHAEVEFHRGFMKLSENPLIVELYTIVLKFMQISASYLLASQSIREEAFLAHNKIIEALEQKNVEKCIKAIEKHLDIACNNLRIYFAEHES